MSSTLGEMFGLFRHNAWRAECRDTYTVAGEEGRIATFLSGTPLPRKTRENNGWIATVEDAVAREAQIGRVRLVGRPITPYTRFEFAAYPDNVAAGESVSAVDRANLHPAWSSVPDFWVFDDEVVFVQHYDGAGRFLGAVQVPDIGPFLEVRRRLITVAVAVAEFELTDIPAQRRGDVVGPPPALPVGLVRATG